MDPSNRSRYLRFGVPPSPLSTTVVNSYELNEDEVLWNSNYSTQERPLAAGGQIRRQSSLPKPAGMLALLPDSKDQSAVYRKSSSSAKPIPKPLPEFDYGGPVQAKINQSAPVRVPVLSAAALRERRSRYRENDWDDEWEADGEEEMLPPHEIVARNNRRSPRTAFSVLEGAGRTLKGRDLRQVRNAVWRQTGFID